VGDGRDGGRGVRFTGFTGSTTSITGAPKPAGLDDGGGGVSLFATGAGSDFMSGGGGGGAGGAGGGMGGGLERGGAVGGISLCGSGNGSGGRGECGSGDDRDKDGGGISCVVVEKKGEVPRREFADEKKVVGRRVVQEVDGKRLVLVHGDRVGSGVQKGEGVKRNRASALELLLEMRRSERGEVDEVEFVEGRGRGSGRDGGRGAAVRGPVASHGSRSAHAHAHTHTGATTARANSTLRTSTFVRGLGGRLTPWKAATARTWEEREENRERRREEEEARRIEQEIERERARKMAHAGANQLKSRLMSAAYAPAQSSQMREIANPLHLRLRLRPTPPAHQPDLRHGGQRAGGFVGMAWGEGDEAEAVGGKELKENRFFSMQKVRPRSAGAVMGTRGEGGGATERGYQEKEGAVGHVEANGREGVGRGVGGGRGASALTNAVAHTGKSSTNDVPHEHRNSDTNTARDKLASARTHTHTHAHAHTHAHTRRGRGVGGSAPRYRVPAREGGVAASKQFTRATHGAGGAQPLDVAVLGASESDDEPVREEGGDYSQCDNEHENEEEMRAVERERERQKELERQRQLSLLHPRPPRLSLLHPRPPRAPRLEVSSPLQGGGGTLEVEEGRGFMEDGGLEGEGGLSDINGCDSEDDIDIVLAVDDAVDDNAPLVGGFFWGAVRGGWGGVEGGTRRARGGGRRERKESE